MEKIIKTLLSIALLYCAYLATTFGTANILFKQTEKQLISWQQQKLTQSSFEKKSAEQQAMFRALYATHLEAIDSAINLHNNPQYIEAKAQLFEWGALLGFADKETNLPLANELYRQSLQLRPAWAPTWAAMALNKWHLGEFDQDLIGYLLNAYRFGKNRSEVKTLWIALLPTLETTGLIEQNPELQIVAKHYQQITP